MSQYTNMDQELINDFVEEVLGHLDQIEAECLAWVNSGVSQEILNSLFRSFHTIKGLAGFVDQNEILELAHLIETALDNGRKGTLASTEINALILDCVDYMRSMCSFLILGQKEKPDAKQLLTKLNCWLNKYDVTSDNATTPTVPVFSTSQEMMGDASVTSDTKASSSSSIKVPSTRIDGLIDMMGELLITQSILEQHVRARHDANDIIMQDLTRLTKLTKIIQGAAMAMRMTSLKPTFQKTLRVGQDAMLHLNRNVRMVVWGEETEIDRGVAEKLIEPLLHLVRNALAHGIEETEARIARGKPVQGTVEFGAYSKRGYVYIQVADDGAGIDCDKVYQKAVNKGMADANRQYSQEEIIEFLFAPGFSTADGVDTISGRGVGLDVVRSEVAKLGGKVDLRTKLNQGTTFTLKIPINLAILNGTIIKIADRQYIVPTLSIKQIIKPEREQWVSVGGFHSLVRLRDDVIPLVDINSVLGQQATSNDDHLVVVLEVENQLRAITVAEVVERRDIVVKPLHEEFSGLSYATGAAILGDGTISLILDVEYLIKLGVRK